MAHLLTEREAAAYLNLSSSFLRHGRIKGTGPEFLKLGRAIRYHVDDLDSWCGQQKKKNTLYSIGSND